MSLAIQPIFRFDIAPWLEVRDADPRARALFSRHYSKYHYADGRQPAKFIGPGEYICLLTPEADAMFVWKKFLDASGQQGPRLSSDLILAAECYAWRRWPGERLYTYINPRKIRSSNPGYCFLRAGWRRCGVTKTRRLIIMEKLP
jgi:hypothetical protein